MNDDTQSVTMPEIIITPEKSKFSQTMAELWQHRELLFFLTWRTISIRYKQTLLGALWAIIRPLFTMVIFSLFFGRLAQIPSDGVPYPIFSFAALVPWTFFSNSLTQATNSVVGNANLIKKVYFPRIAIPISAVLAELIDFILAFIILIAMMFFYGIVPTQAIIWVPVLILLTMITAIGVGLWLTVLNVRFRDIHYTVPFLVQAWLFATPVVYSSSLLSEFWRSLYAVNPMVGVIDGFRWALLGIDSAVEQTMIVSAIVSLGLLISGIFYFAHLEDTFADIV